MRLITIYETVLHRHKVKSRLQLIQANIKLKATRLKLQTYMYN